jgi:catechol 2,3-dioxygenase-like lactoylglutathione lyase family enzyme
MQAANGDAMADDNPSILSHVSIGTNHFEGACAFYDKALAPLGCRRILEHPGAVAYGKLYPEFWVQTPIDGKPANIGNGTHIGFVATSKEAVHAFYDAALAAGAKSDGAPGPRPEYGEPYYGCFLRDPDGHKIEAAFFDIGLAKKLGLIQEATPGHL